jgi:hypothetical protein
MPSESVAKINRDSVFIAGGQPTVTYVDRANLKVEENFKRAMRVPNQIVSLAGAHQKRKNRPLSGSSHRHAVRLD